MQVDSPSLGRQDSFPAGSPQGPPNLCCAPRQAVPPPTRARSCGLGVLRAPHPPRTTCPAQPKRKLRARLCDLPRATQRRSETGRLHGLGLWAPDCWRVSPGQAAAPEEGHPRSGGCTRGGSPPGRLLHLRRGPPRRAAAPRGGSPPGRPLLSSGPQAVPGPLVLPKQGLTVSRHAGHRCARGCPELSLRCASCSCAPEPCTPIRARAQAQPSPSAASRRTALRPPALGVCVRSPTASLDPQTGHPRNASVEVPGALTHSLQSSWGE